VKFMVDDSEVERTRRLLQAGGLDYKEINSNVCVVNSRKLMEAADFIDEGLNWDTTPEGEDFWCNVYAKLIEYSRLEERW